MQRIAKAVKFTRHPRALAVTLGSSALLTIRVQTPSFVYNLPQTCILIFYYGSP